MIVVVPLIDYFAAADDSDALRGLVPGGPAGAGFPAIPAKGIDPAVALGKLTAILTGRRYDEVVADPHHCRPISDEGAESLVVSVADVLRDALARADNSRLADAAAEWCQADEVASVDAAHLIGLLTELRALALDALRTDSHLYCAWTL